MYEYDARGRTPTVTPPGGAGSTTYFYDGNTVKVTDAAGKWKKYETDCGPQKSRLALRYGSSFSSLYS